MAAESAAMERCYRMTSLPRELMCLMALSCPMAQSHPMGSLNPRALPRSEPCTSWENRQEQPFLVNSPR